MSDQIDQAVAKLANEPTHLSVEIALAGVDGQPSDRRATLTVPLDMRNDDVIRVIHSTLETHTILVKQRKGAPAKRSPLWTPPVGQG